MNEFTGQVKAINKRDWKNGIFLYNMVLEGSPILHQCGSNKPDVEEGEWVKITLQNRKVKTVEKIPAPATDGQEKTSGATESTAKDSPSAPSATPIPTQPTSPTAVGERIRYQQARRDAVQLVTTAMETKLLPYPMSGKAPDKWERMMDLITQTTKDLILMEDK